MFTPYEEPQLNLSRRDSEDPKSIRLAPPPKKNDPIFGRSKKLLARFSNSRAAHKLQDDTDALSWKTVVEQQRNTAHSSSFNQLLDVHYIKDRVSEALLVLEANSRIVEDLNCEYQRILSSITTNEGEIGHWKDAILDFEGRMSTSSMS